MFVIANFDGYLDHWYFKMYHPTNMPVYTDTQNPDLIVTEGPAMNVPYIDRYGNNQVLYADLTTKTPNQNSGDTLLLSHFSSTISTMGYWDPYNTGEYESYGTVKWAAGYHDYMFSFGLQIAYGVVDADFTLDLYMTSTPDWRGYTTLNAHPITNYHIHVGYQPGDVTGSGELTIGDVGLLEDWLLHGFEGATPYQLDAADVDRDGVIDIADLQALIDILLNL